MHRVCYIRYLFSGEEYPVRGFSSRVSSRNTRPAFMLKSRQAETDLPGIAKKPLPTTEQIRIRWKDQNLS